MMNRAKYEKHLKEIILAFTLPITILFIYDFQIKVLKYDTGLWLYLLLCIGEVILAIIIGRKRK